ncbi:hypothetical protein HOG48_03985 [Candidatus Peregrinibacteria bacterium]|jgi:hypothetical protein|nr:hypothetical protein [Candidatus Peregrinibacteria bacterium]
MTVAAVVEQVESEYILDALIQSGEIKPCLDSNAVLQEWEELKLSDLEPMMDHVTELVITTDERLVIPAGVYFVDEGATVYKTSGMIITDDFTYENGGDGHCKVTLGNRILSFVGKVTTAEEITLREKGLSRLMRTLVNSIRELMIDVVVFPDTKMPVIESENYPHLKFAFATVADVDFDSPDVELGPDTLLITVSRYRLRVESLKIGRVILHVYNGSKLVIQLLENKLRKDYEPVLCMAEEGSECRGCGHEESCFGIKPMFIYHDESSTQTRGKTFAQTLQEAEDLIDREFCEGMHLRHFGKDVVDLSDCNEGLDKELGIEDNPDEVDTDGGNGNGNGNGRLRIEDCVLSISSSSAFGPTRTTGLTPYPGIEEEMI